MQLICYPDRDFFISCTMSSLLCEIARLETLAFHQVGMEGLTVRLVLLF